jgi:transposase
LIPGRLYKENIYEETYKCADCERVDGISHMYQGKAPTALIAHSFASTSLVAEVGYHKFVLGTHPALPATGLLEESRVGVKR